MEATWLQNREPPTAPLWGDTVYRVRIWVPQSEPYTGWAVDDWSVTDAADVTEVIAWAAEEAARFSGGSCEVFVQAVDHHMRGDGELAEQIHHVPVYGKPADEGVNQTILSFRSN